MKGTASLILASVFLLGLTIAQNTTKIPLPDNTSAQYNPPPATKFVEPYNLPTLTAAQKKTIKENMFRTPVSSKPLVKVTADEMS